METAREPRALQDRIHWVVLYADVPGRREVGLLEAAGARVLGHVPDTGLLIAAARGLGLPETGWVRAGPLSVTDKISQALDVIAPGEQSAVFLAEFHPDVRTEEARHIALTERLSIREHPDLAANHLLLEGTPARMRALAEWDEVAYVFPASRELIEGRPARACAGAVSEAGGIGQYVSRFGEGWDGPGRNAARLLYSFERLTETLPRQVLEEEMTRAMREWMRHVQVEFAPGGERGRRRHVNILFAAGGHGDPFPFDGRGRTLAHTFFPAPPNPEPIAGDMHLDEEENWHSGADIDVYSVVLHELGHALGLGHSDDPRAVMYAYYRRAQELTEEDIAAIQTMYAAREAEKPKEPPDVPRPPPDVPPTDTGKGMDRSAPSLAITFPGMTLYQTSRPAISIRGLARDDKGVAQVSWQSNNGFAGKAAGTANWVAENVPLLVGTNTIIVRARDLAGKEAWRAVMIVRR